MVSDLTTLFDTNAATPLLGAGEFQAVVLSRVAADSVCREPKVWWDRVYAKLMRCDLSACLLDSRCWWEFPVRKLCGNLYAIRAMTAQIQDRLIIYDTEYDIVGVNGHGLFQPTEHGLEPQPCSTDCYRGFHCTYAMEDGHLLLTTLLLASNGDPPGFLGVAPHKRMIQVRKWTLFRGWIPEDIPEDMFRYEGLQHPVLYDGGLLIASDFIQELYIHMGFQPAWTYHNVLECSFAHGLVTAIKDRSQRLAEIRQRVTNQPSSGAPPSQEQVSAWIERSFDLRYRPLG